MRILRDVSGFAAEVEPIGFPRRSLFRAALRQRPQVKILVGLLVLVSTGLGVAVPWMQRMFVNGLGEGALHLTWVFLAFAATLAAQGILYMYRMIALREGLLLQKSLSQAVYRKAISLAHSERAGRTVGELITYYAQDVATASLLIEDVFPQLLTGIIPLALAPLVLGFMLDVPLGGILTILIANLMITVWLGFRQAHFFVLNKRNAQHRLALVNEWLQNIRILRVLGWVGSFEEEIRQRREQESADRLRMVTNGSTMNSLTQTVPFLLNLVTVLSLIATRGRALSPGDVFAVLWIFGVFLARPLRFIPFILVTWNDVATSARRLAKFLLLPDESDVLGVPQGTLHPEAREAALAVENLELVLDNRKVLSDVSFQCGDGEFVAIVGEVGSGKSLLLQSLLRAVPATFARYRLGGDDALRLSLQDLRSCFVLAPQDAFIMSSSLRDNVAFEYHTSESLDSELADTLRLAEFDPDREHLLDGLSTQIGERGVNLSGGQRQRVNLARCIHFGRPIVLLDDSLSAVDVETERRLQERLLNGHWRNHTRILVTHRLSILPHVDRILVLENGRLVEQGTPQELLEHSPRLAHLAATARGSR